MSELNILENQIREAIRDELQKVNSVNSPNVYSRIQTKEDYAKMEERIIERILCTRISPAAVVPQMEQEYEMM
jgi:hypothetical protein